MVSIHCAGYIRVSTKGQIDDESLLTQKNSITRYAEEKGFELTEIYEDAGISGGSVEERHALLRCLHDAELGKFKVLIIHRLSRFGRNARELLNNHNQLEKIGIDIISISEGIDFGSKYGKAILGILAIIAELEKDIIREQMLENRIARSKRGVPAVGSMPYGRTFDRKSNTWSVDEDLKKGIVWAAEEYLKGTRLMELGKALGMSYVNLNWIFKYSCSDKWKIQFKGEEPIIYNVPRLLPDHIIAKVHERQAFNRRNNRTDIVNKYILSGFIRCEKCGNLFSGMTQRSKTKDFQYYAHVTRPRSDCKGTATIRMKPIEKAVFETIFENIIDVPSFERSIKESLPDEKMVKGLQVKIEDSKKELKKVQRELDKLVESVLRGTLSDETIKVKEKELIERRVSISNTLESDEMKLKSLPSIESIKNEAGRIRKELLEKYSGKERLMEMSYEEKRELLHFLFDGKDHEGKPYGIYVFKHPDQSIDYFLYGKIQGLRTLRGEDINYVESNTDFNTNKDIQK